MRQTPSAGLVVKPSGQIWAGLGYAGSDTVEASCEIPVPAPVDITGSCAGDRCLFFTARDVTQRGGRS